MGIDIVVHSCSKYIGGHSDVIGGVVIGSAADIEYISQTEYLNIGAISHPFNSWLMLRGLRTLSVRMTQHMKSVKRIIEFLDTRDEVVEIMYPFYDKHPQKELAGKQMKGGSGLLSIRVNTKNENKIAGFTNTLKHFFIATSWGGFESLIIPAAAINNVEKEYKNVIRLHIGLEDPELLIDDLKNAFNTTF